MAQVEASEREQHRRGAAQALWRQRAGAYQVLDVDHHVTANFT